MRKAIVAGQFYPADAKELEKQIKASFESPFGPGKLGFMRNKKIRGTIAPHAGYVYSGACAAHCYKELYESEKQHELFVLLGVNHSGYGSADFALSLENFQTPLGVVFNNNDFAKKLLETEEAMKKEKDLPVIDLKQDEEPHRYEHSIEVQLPFLQHLFKEIRIVPIIVSSIDLEKCKALGTLIADVAKAEHKHVFIIASSDFTHYGSSYGFVPFSDNVKQKLHELDKSVIEPILKLDGKAFFEKATKTTVCGTGPITVAIEACKALGSKRAKLLKYYTSGDITRDYTNAVGYASIVFE